VESTRNGWLDFRANMDLDSGNLFFFHFLQRYEGALHVCSGLVELIILGSPAIVGHALQWKSRYGKTRYGETTNLACLEERLPGLSASLFPKL